MGWDGDEMEWDGSALCEGLPSSWALLHRTTNVTGVGCPSALRQVCAVLYKCCSFRAGRGIYGGHRTESGLIPPPVSNSTAEDNPCNTRSREGGILLLINCGLVNNTVERGRNYVSKRHTVIN